MGMPRNIRGSVRLTLLLSRETIAALVNELALQLWRDNAGKDLLLVGVLKGDFVFLADRSRDVEIPVQVEFVRLASDGKGTTSAGPIGMILHLEVPIAGHLYPLLPEIRCPTAHRRQGRFMRQCPREADRMQHRVLALDYDGTSAQDGVLDP